MMDWLPIFERALVTAEDNPGLLRAHNAGLCALIADAAVEDGQAGSSMSRAMVYHALARLDVFKMFQPERADAEGYWFYAGEEYDVDPRDYRLTALAFMITILCEGE